MNRQIDRQAARTPLSICNSPGQKLEDLTCKDHTRALHHRFPEGEWGGERKRSMFHPARSETTRVQQDHCWTVWRQPRGTPTDGVERPWAFVLPYNVFMSGDWKVTLMLPCAASVGLKSWLELFSIRLFSPNLVCKSVPYQIWANVN